jgi:CubicO group peptidase (beta-lactamase class C family)
VATVLPAIAVCLCHASEPTLTTANTTPLSDSDEELLECKVDRYLDSLPDPFNGTILLAIGDDILMNKGYGLANRTYDIPNTPDTKFQIASFQKPMTTILAIRLAEQGILDLNTTIDTYLPDYPKDKASKITIDHLLRHRSGIKHHFDAIPDYFRVHDSVFHTPREYLELFWDSDLAHEPGTDLTYSTPGFCLVGILLETITGKSYPELLRGHLLDPLGMSDTFVENQLTIHKNLATGYKMGISGYVRDRSEEMSNVLASGDVITTTADLYKFQRMLHHEGDDVLSEASKKLLLGTDTRHDASPGDPYIGRREKYTTHSGEPLELTVYGHGTGSNYGFRSHMTRFIEIDACYIVLTNIHKDRAVSHQLYGFLESLLLNELGIDSAYDGADPSRIAEADRITIDPQISEGCQGAYRIGEGCYFILYQEGTTLRCNWYRTIWGAWYAGEGALTTANNRMFNIEGSPGLLLSIRSDGQIGLIENGRFRGKAQRIDNDNPQIPTEYAGEYYSIELQKTYSFSIRNGRLVAEDFLGEEFIALTQLSEDLDTRLPIPRA